MFNMTEAVPILREVILPGVREYMQHATVLLKYLQRKPQSNDNGIIQIVYHRQGDNNAGTGAAENATIVDAYVQKFGRASIGAKSLYKRCRWTGKVIAATRNNKDTLIDAILSETEYGIKDFKTSVNRQLNGDERDALGYYVSGAGTTTVVVTDRWGNIGGDYFRGGTTVVDLMNGSTHAIKQSGLTATRGALGATGRTITVSANLDGTATAGDYFVLNNAFSATSTSQQLQGLQSIVDNANPVLAPVAGLQGTPVGTVPEFAAVVVEDNASGIAGAASTWTDLRFEDMQRVLTEIDIVADEGADGVSLIYTSPQGFDTYVKVCKDERIAVNNMSLDGGFRGVSFNGRLPLVADKHARRGAYYFLNFDAFALYELSQLDWADLHGSMFEKVANKDVYESMLVQYLEFGVHIRNASGVLRGKKMIF